MLPMLCIGRGRIEGLTHCREVREMVLLAFYQRCRYIQQIAASELQCNAKSVKSRPAVVAGTGRCEGILDVNTSAEAPSRTPGSHAG